VPGVRSRVQGVADHTMLNRALTDLHSAPMHKITLAKSDWFSYCTGAQNTLWSPLC